MAINVNLRHLEVKNVQLQGELPAQALDLDVRDELVEVRPP